MKSNTKNGTVIDIDDEESQREARNNCENNLWVLLKALAMDKDEYSSQEMPIQKTGEYI
jgi:hypothetical protein